MYFADNQLSWANAEGSPLCWGSEQLVQPPCCSQAKWHKVNGCFDKLECLEFSVRPLFAAIIIERGWGGRGMSRAIGVTEKHPNKFGDTFYPKMPDGNTFIIIN